MTYGHAEVTLNALRKFDIHFLTRDLVSLGYEEEEAGRVAEVLVYDRGWTRNRNKTT